MYEWITNIAVLCALLKNYQNIQKLITSSVAYHVFNVWGQFETRTYTSHIIYLICHGISEKNSKVSVVGDDEQVTGGTFF